MGAEIVGISVDSHFCHQAFAAAMKFRFLLVSDFERQVIGEFAGYFDNVAGYRGVNKRRILVLDQAARVAWTWTASNPGDIPDTEMVREAVQEVVHGD